MVTASVLPWIFDFLVVVSFFSLPWFGTALFVHVDSLGDKWWFNVELTARV